MLEINNGKTTSAQAKKDLHEAFDKGAKELADLFGADCLHLYLGSRGTAFIKVHECSAMDMVHLYKSVAEDLVEKINPNIVRGLAAFAGGASDGGRPIDEEGNPLMKADEVARAMANALKGIPKQYQDIVKAEVSGRLKMANNTTEDDMIDELLS